ncbi:MAG: TonB-dependent receptor [Acidobacteria bacterium]|nr:TonB-dependent receptor [Acidobacteriota bacterium]
MRLTRFLPRFLAAAATLALAALPAQNALAGETGSISGKVSDPSGGALPGVTIKVSGPQLPAGRMAVSLTNGSYSFTKLNPGTYKVEASLAGLGEASREVRVQVDNDAQVDLVVAGAGVATQVSVTAGLIDQKATEVNFNYTDQQIASLPLARSYAGLFQLVPGVADTNLAAGGYVSAGAALMENSFQVDGVTIGNPGFGYLSIETNQLDIVDFNVKKGAISAEFGRTSGIVTNAVTRTGTNDLKGSVWYEGVPQSLAANPKSGLSSSIDRHQLAANVGFPILKDTLFGYVSGRYNKRTTSDRVNGFGALPDTDYKETEAYAKLTAYPSQQHFVNVAFRLIPNKTTDGYDATTNAPTRGYDTENRNQTISATWNWFASPQTNVEARFVHLTEENSLDATTIVAVTPTPFDFANPTRMGSISVTTVTPSGTGGVYPFRQNDQNYKRDELKMSASHFADYAGANHNLKIGVGFETTEEFLLRLTNGWGDLITTTTGGVAAFRARYYPDQPAQRSLSRTYSIYFQDTATWNRVTANIGMLINRDEFAQDVGAGRNTFLSWSWGKEIQPRLGVIYNGDFLKGDKIYANYGRYYNLDLKSSSRSLAPNRIFQRQAFFRRDNGALISDAPLASTTGKLIDPALKPTYTDEIVLGYGAPIGRLISFEAYGQYKHTKNFIEDVPSTYPQSGPYKAANLPNARRQYKAITVDVSKRYADRWTANVSYTYSRLEGNFDIDYSGGGVFNTSSFLQDGPGWYVEDPNRYGLLGQDRPHVFKAFGSYDVMGITVGGYFRFQSGTAWEARGADSQSSTYNRYLEKAGSRRNDNWTNVDLLASYRLDLGVVGIKVEGRVLNVFNSQTALSRDRVQYFDPFSINNNTPPLYENPQGTTQPNANFGNPSSFAPPRRLQVSAIVDF